MADGGRSLTRFLLLAAPAGGKDKVGALDGNAIRARLPLPDTAFSLVSIEPFRDMAEQVDEFFDRKEVAPDSTVLLFVSATVLQSVDHEIFLCLDPNDLATGDSLHDLAMVFKDRARGPVGFLLDLRDQIGRDASQRAAAARGSRARGSLAIDHGD